MARGDVTMFDEFLLELGKETHNLTSDTLKLGIVDNTITPLATQTTPTWSDFSTNEVATTGNYTANGETLTTVTWTLISGIPTLKADDVNRPDFEEAGLPAFKPFDDKPTIMQYYRAPAEVFENSEALDRWVGGAVQAGRRAKGKPTKRKSARRRR